MSATFICLSPVPGGEAVKKVFVKGWIEDHSLDTSNVAPEHHSVPVRFKTENGTYEWLWVRKNNVTLCLAKKPSKTRRKEK